MTRILDDGRYLEAARKAAKYAQPMLIGDKKVVRIRRVTIEKNFAGMTWVGFRLTHPRGRRSLNGADFPMREAALRYAKSQGWTVVGPDAHKP